MANSGPQSQQISPERAPTCSCIGNALIGHRSAGGPLAQLDRVADFESAGSGFESSRGHQFPECHGAIQVDVLQGSFKEPVGVDGIPITHMQNCNLSFGRASMLSCQCHVRGERQSVAEFPFFEQSFPTRPSRTRSAHRRATRVSPLMSGAHRVVVDRGGNHRSRCCGADGAEGMSASTRKLSVRRNTRFDATDTGVVFFGFAAKLSRL